MLAIGLPLLWQECSPALWCDFSTLRWQNADCWRQSPSFVLTLSDRGLQCSPLCCSVLATTTTTAPVNGLFSRTVWVSRYQNCRTSMDINEARDDRVLGCSGISWTICKKTTCTSFLSDNYTNPSSLNFLQAGCSSWCPTNSVKTLKAQFWTHSNNSHSFLYTVNMPITEFLNLYG